MGEVYSDVSGGMKRFLRNLETVIWTYLIELDDHALDVHWATAAVNLDAHLGAQFKGLLGLYLYVALCLHPHILLGHDTHVPPWPEW